MKKICVITTCRADYPYLYWIMKDIEASDKLQLQIIHPENHHNSKEIYQEFIKNGTAQHLDTDSIYSIGYYGQFYNDCLKNLRILKPDMVIVLGDRFEIHAAATAALLLNIPIAHIHGGEVTTGAFDNELRNSITQMATYHFTATFEYAENVARMKGLCTPDHYNCLYKYNFKDFKYPDSNIYVTGSPGLDWLTRAKLLSKQELQQRVTIDLNQPFIVACFHPVTKELVRTKEHIKSFIEAMEALKTQALWIGPNIDPGFTKIIQKVNEKLGWVDGWVGVDNLDHLTYLSLLQYAEMMVGNSSSGVIESVSFNIPSVSVGSRQDGRIKASNTFSCPCETEAILTAIDRAREWNATVGRCDNPYGDGKSSQRIVEVLENV